MATSEEIAEKIASSAVAGVQSASNDSGSVTSMTISEQIKAAHFVASQNAGSKPHFGLRFTKCIPPGGG
jgi:hypothetical protein